MTRTSAWDEIDATLLSIAKTRPTLTDLVKQSKLSAPVVKDLVHAYVRGGWLTTAPFSPCYELTLLGRTKLAELNQAAAPKFAKAA
jgi:hypothetical protein